MSWAVLGCWSEVGCVSRSALEGGGSLVMRYLLGGFGSSVGRTLGQGRSLVARRGRDMVRGSGSWRR